MALSLTEIESITKDYYVVNGSAAVDIYFDSSFWMWKFMQNKFGMWERPEGGDYIRIPFEFDEAEGGFYSRSEALSSDDRDTVNTARFQWKHAYGNGTIYRHDELKNSGAYAAVSLVSQRLSGAQKTCAKRIASNIYNEVGDSSIYITGLRSMCSETSSTKYGDVAEDDLVSDDGTKKWEGKNNTTSESIGLAVLRTQRSDAKIRDGRNGRPDFYTTTETLFNKIKGVLQPMQRFTEDKATTKAGFSNLVFEGMTIAADDYVPSGYGFAVNSKYVGFAVHKDGYYKRDPWRKLDGPQGKTMKILWDGNIICSNRRAHKSHSNLT